MTTFAVTNSLPPQDTCCKKLYRRAPHGSENRSQHGGDPSILLAGARYSICNRVTTNIMPNLPAISRLGPAKF